MCKPVGDAALQPFSGRVRLIELRQVAEPRGRLVEIDYGSLPFTVRRSFVVDRVPAGVVRGGHAHRECEQILICLQGKVRVNLRLADNRAEVLLNDNSQGLYVGAGVWFEQRYDTDARLLVLASLPFDSDSYVDDPDRA